MASLIPVKEFNDRRHRLMERMAPDSIAILPAAPERVRNRDVLHPFRQDSDFHYLTGFWTYLCLCAPHVLSSYHYFSSRLIFETL